MIASLRRLALTASLTAAALMPALAAENFSAAQRDEIGNIVRDYLLKNPQVLQEAYQELERRQAVADAEKHRAAVKTHAQMLFSSPRQVTLGNPNGDVTMVEFFDYNCGFCKRAMDDMMALLKSDPKLKVVLKEFPVLGPGSLEAAKVAAAAMLQDKSGKKYLEFHLKLMGGRGEANKARALAVARDTGFDVARIEREMEGPAVSETLQESAILSQALGLNGTPSYVVGNEVVVGAVGLETLRSRINHARCGKVVC